uniref:Uncharacterized protein n=1 Tax=Vombatus ursinus TaxID=29139 RepID=A0A4X2KGC8_VOMUR
MQLPALKLWVPILLTDLTLLWLLQEMECTVFLPGLSGLWGEGAFRVGVLWGVLSLLGGLGKVEELLPTLYLSTPLFLSLKALVPGALSAPPVLLGSAPSTWMLVSYGGVGLGWSVWKVLSPSEPLPSRLMRLSWPDFPFLVAAFIFLAAAVVDLPHYTGRVTDILGQDFDPDAFATAIFFMCLFSLGRSVTWPGG